ncbi:hypothetical protein [Rhizobium leguminosarum]|uniref:hypothetical protein n=1 Tax=Rhizobium leguminosarum TaxID=384 RepID=UPI0015590DD3|nr:hypothetical protein [Rhizobium leguminosarum]
MIHLLVVSSDWVWKINVMAGSKFPLPGINAPSANVDVYVKVSIASIRLEPFEQWHKLPAWKMEDLSVDLPTDRRRGGRKGERHDEQHFRPSERGQA